MKYIAVALCVVWAGLLINSAEASERKVERPEKKEAVSTAGQIVDDAKMVKPLKAGEKVPAVTIYSGDSKTVQLKKLVQQKPTVLVFYRGGWCPYCNKHLSALSSADAELKKLGYQIIALSIDSPEFVKKAAVDKSYSYTLYSDYKGDAAKAFGLAFKVNDALVKKYKNSYSIDLEKYSGQEHHILPVPAVYLIDTNGKIQFLHHDANYKKRLDNKILLKKAKALQSSPKGSGNKSAGPLNIIDDHKSFDVSISEWDPALPGYHFSSSGGIGRVKISSTQSSIKK